MFLTVTFQIVDNLPEILILGGSALASIVVYFFKRRKK